MDNPSNDINLLVGMFDADFLRDQEFLTWESWYILSKYYRINSQHQKSYECAKKGITLCPPEDKVYNLHEEISIVSYYLRKIEEGYFACEHVINSKFAPNDVKALADRNKEFYIK